MSNINVTPLVDVMLVLLIVFMITAPMLTVGVQVDLPKTKANQLNIPSAHLSSDTLLGQRQLQCLLILLPMQQVEFVLQCSPLVSFII